MEQIAEPPGEKKEGAKAGASSLPFFSEHFRPEKMNFKFLFRSEKKTARAEKKLKELGYKIKIMPRREEIRELQKELERLSQFAEVLLKDKKGGKPGYPSETALKEYAKAKDDQQLLTVLALCLWKTRPRFRAAFTHDIAKELVASAIGAFSSLDGILVRKMLWGQMKPEERCTEPMHPIEMAKKALSILADEKQYEPREQGDLPESWEDWSKIAIEFPLTCRQFLKNKLVGSSLPKRNFWVEFSESIDGRFSKPDDLGLPHGEPLDLSSQGTYFGDGI